MAASEFISRFYNIEGNLISERKACFFRLLKAQTTPLTEKDLEGLSPRNYLEQLFQVDIFIHFKLIPKLLDIIKKGNEVFVSKILKHPLLLKEIIGGISAESFVNDFLPCTSYSLRMKILKRISFFLDESQMDEIIFWVHKRYGLFIAVKILHTCSSDKIREYLNTTELILKPRQIKYIFDKDPELFLEYVNHYKTVKGTLYSHRNLNRYIALKNSEFWLRLRKEKIMDTTVLGRRTSKRIIRYNNADFINNIKYYLDFLKLNIAVRSLTGKFNEVYFTFFPKNQQELNASMFCNKLLQNYPKKKQWDLFTETFSRAFNKNIMDNLILLPSYFIRLFPNTDVLNKWGEAHYNKNKSNDMLKYCHPSKAIPLIKEKINVTSDQYERKELIKLLLENCSSNKDMATLEEVLKYINGRHRNEDTTADLLRELRFKLQELTENHWNYINQIFSYLRIKDKLPRYYNDEFSLRYMEYLILQGKPFRDELITYIKDITDAKSDFYIRLENPEIKRKIWIDLFSVFPEVIPLDGNINLKQTQERFIDKLICFNEENIEHSINVEDFPWLFAYVNNALNKDLVTIDDGEKRILRRIIHYNLKFRNKPLTSINQSQILQLLRHIIHHFENTIAMMVLHKDRSDFENDILQFFWDTQLHDYYLRRKIIRWLFINEPVTLISHYDRLLPFIHTCVDVKNIKLMSHLGFDKKLKDYCINKLEGLDKDLQKGINEAERDTYIQTIQVLSVLLLTEEYIGIVKAKFIPGKSRVDVTDDPSLNSIYPLQCKVVYCLKNVLEPALALSVLMKFCTGDYLKSALSSLYSIFYRAPENLLCSHIKALSKQAVSVRKHALFLSCELLNFNYVSNMFRDIKESNISSQKHVFLTLLRYFRKNPTDELMQLIAINLNKIDKNDEETLNKLVNIEIPKNFKIRYIQICWYTYENLRQQDVDIERYLNSIVAVIIQSEYLLTNLQIDFCEHIIKNYFKDIKPRLNNINDFVAKILKYRGTPEIYKFVFDVLAEVKTMKKINFIKNFFKAVYYVADKDVKNNKIIDRDNNYYIEIFRKHWFYLFTNVEMFDEYVALNVLYLKCKYFDNNMDSYAQGMVMFVQQLVHEFGVYIYFKVKQLLLTYISFDTNKEIYLFLYNVLKCNNSVFNCFLVIDFLKNNLCSDESRDTYTKIIKILESSNDPAVMVYFNSYMADQN